MPEIRSIRRETGIAGQYAYRVVVKYEGEAESVVRFVGSVYGGPIVLAPAGTGIQAFVSRSVLVRLGSKLTVEWIRAFYAPKEPAA